MSAQTPALKSGDRVRVRGDCPHTLPSFARMLIGEVLGAAEHGNISVRFGADDRIFPIPPSCLVAVDGPDSQTRQ